MMSTNKLWLAIKQDTVLVNTGYIVRAISDEEASDSVNNGRYLKEEENDDF